MQLQWLGHSAFLLTTDQGKRVLIDPFLSGNPVTPESFKDPDDIDVILLTHGHDDHTADAIPIAKKTGAKVVSIVELSHLLKRDGLPEQQALEMNMGGTVRLDDIRVTMTSARHSSSWKGEYAGDPAGFVIETSGRRIYHAGDTAIMGDFKLYGELYKPDIALLPIGDHYTMGPADAALACELLQPGHAVPMHYGTMPVLAGKPEDFAKMVHERTHGSVKVVIARPGDDIMTLM